MLTNELPLRECNVCGIALHDDEYHICSFCEDAEYFEYELEEHEEDE